MKWNWSYAGLAALLAGLLLCGCGQGETAHPLPPDGAVSNPQAEVGGPVEPLICLSDSTAPYTIVRSELAGQTVIDATIALNEALGGGVTLATDWVPRGEEAVYGKREILVGPTNRPESADLCADLGEHDYRIAFAGDKLVIAALSDAAVANAVAALIRGDAIEKTAQGYAVARDISLSFGGARSRDEYIADPGLFLCSWVLDFDVPEWLTDYAEKTAAWADADGRMMSAIHRGEYFHYPENSIEGIISAIHMGCDSVELDCQLTADGVPVLMHDVTLGRTTDWEAKKGRNGLPTSDKLHDWTLDELRRLRLRMNDGTQTDYLIPTLAEVLTVCENRIWLRLDKLDAWSWDDDIFPVLEETGAYSTVILNHQFGLARQKKIMEAISGAGHSGSVLFYLALENGDAKNWLPLIDTLNSKGLFPIAWWRGYDKKDSTGSLDGMRGYLNQIKGRTRIYVDAQALGGAKEAPDIWDNLMRCGINFILVDDAMALQQYIAERFSPASETLTDDIRQHGQQEVVTATK